MGRGHGSVGVASSAVNARIAPPGFTDVQTVKEALMEYSRVDKWNKNTEYRMGFNDDAQAVVEKLAKGDYGLASTIAKQAVDSPNWNKYGYKFSEKQAYVMGKAAVENALVSNSVIFDKSIKMKAAQDNARKSAAKAAAYAKYSESYTKSSTKIAIGSPVTDSKGRKGIINGIITKSSGYVSVKYNDGSVSKQMAFNLFGEDGNPLKKKPKQ